MLNRLAISRVRAAVSRGVTWAQGAASASEDGVYPDFCRLAADDSKVFETFRRHPDYTRVLEHVPEAMGRDYARLSGATRPDMMEAAKNDFVGSPVRISIDGIPISSTTLRYLKNAMDIGKLFGSLKGARVCEIGVGYGGLARIMDARHELASYTLIDMRPALDLAERFLSRFPLRGTLEFRTMNELVPQKYDLVISNYAFSELRWELQETYWAKVIGGSARGFMLCNRFTPEGWHPMTFEEMAKRTAGEILPEEPQTGPHNRLIAWGHK